MALHYILDGYNVIYRFPGELPTKLEDRRNVLIRHLEAHKPYGSSRNAVTVVFDGQVDVIGSLEQQGFIKVVFSKDEKADELIKKIVFKLPNKKDVIVITDDRDIQYAVRALGAKFKSVDEFMQFGENKKAKAQSKQGSSKTISHMIEAKINKELENIWLKKK